MRPSAFNQIQTALAGRKLIRFFHRFEDNSVNGYVVAISSSYFVVALVCDRIRFDGFECFRIKDLISIENNPYRNFVESALKKRGLRRARAPRLVLTNAKTILSTIGAKYPLVTIQREEVAPGICHIGKVVATNRTQVALLEISPEATWDTRATAYSLREITRIGFGGAYEEALQLVGGAGDV